MIRTQRRALAAGAIALALVSVGCARGPADWEGVNESAKEAMVAGRLDEAGSLFEEALAMAERFPPGDARLVRSLNNLGEYHRARGDLEAAETYYLRAVEEQEGALQPDYEKLAASYANLAGLYLLLNRPARAADTYAAAAETYARHLPERRTERAAALHNLGLQAMLLGDADRAREALEGALLLWRNSEVSAGTREALTLSSLAEVAAFQGRNDDAEGYFLEAIALLRANEGESDDSVARVYQNLGLFYRRADELEAAERAQREALAIWEARSAGQDDRAVAEALNNLALILRARGRDNEAEGLYRRALAAQEATIGPDAGDVAVTLHNLARLLQARGDIDGADALYSRAADIVERTLAPGSPTRTTVLSTWAAMLDDAGRNDEADAVRRRIDGAG